MKVKELKKVIWIKRIVGTVTGVISLYLIVNALLWGLWISLNASGGLGVKLAEQVARIYTFVHITPKLDVLIKPISLNSLLTSENLYALSAYILFIVSVLLVGSANAQARILNMAISKVEQRNIERSVGGEVITINASDKFGDAELPPMSRAKIAKHVYMTFIAPIIVGVLIVIIVKLLNID